LMRAGEFEGRKDVKRMEWIRGCMYVLYSVHI
jgi:hypothetical protein